MATRLALATLTLCLLQPTIGLGDELIFKNGDRLTGTVVELEAKKVTFRSPALGKLSVPVRRLASFRTDEEIEVHMNDGTVVTSRVDVDSSGTMRFESDTSTAVDLARVDKINPQKPRWKGSLMAGLNYERGDTDKNQADLEFRAGWRNELWRYSFRSVNFSCLIFGKFSILTT